MKVSIVIPARNEEKYLATTLEAVSHLDYPDFEVIVVDNASTDKTADIAKSFPFVTYVLEQKLGTQHAREAGRKKATGEILACLDADNIPDRQWLKRGLKYFKDPTVVAVTGPGDFYDMSRTFRVISAAMQVIFFKPLHEILQFLNIGGITHANNCLIRADALQKVGGYDVSYTFYGDDTDTAKRLTRVGSVLYKLGFSCKASGRRYQKFGYFKTFFLYMYHFFKVAIFTKKKKPKQATTKI